VADTDSDGIPDPFDNCDLRPNGPLLPAAPPTCWTVVGGVFGTQIDSDLDGYGDPCDGDFDNDGNVTGGADATFFLNALMAPPPQPPVADHDCDGNVTGGADATDFLAQLTQGFAGPSGLYCATAPPTVPCVF
jgi:hypothetical protein